MPGKKKKGLTAKERRDLDIEIGFLEGLVRRDPDYLDALQILGDNYTRRKRFTDGLKIDQHLAALRPGDPLIQYNLACSLSLTDQPEAAFAALSCALDNGYREFHWIERDEDLAPFRKHPLYRKLKERIRGMQVKVA